MNSVKEGRAYILVLLLLVPLLPGWPGIGRAADDAEMPGLLRVAGQEFVRNGRGERTRLFITLYEAGLYLRQKCTDAPDILQADKPMAMRLVIRSSLITSEKMEKATLEGLEKSTGGNTAPLEEEILKFIAAFREDIRAGDVFEMIYRPGTGVRVVKNGREMVTVAGLAFKKALYGIWLGQDPVQASLKKDLLGESG
jgi:hypothetical protein